MDDDATPTRKKSYTSVIVSVVVVLIVVVLAVVLLATHKDTSKNQSLTSAQTSAAKQEITKNWQTFFAAKTSLTDRENVLQDGSKFLDPIKSEFTALSGQSSSAAISSIKLTNASNATVTYTVDLNGQPVLTNQTGTAVKINNKWVVSDSTLCGLLGMAGNKPSVCQGVK